MAIGFEAVLSILHLIISAPFRTGKDKISITIISIVIISIVTLCF